jgi:hypothetical protein
MSDTAIRHPQYEERREDWLQMRHTRDGERAVKEAGVRYLPVTEGMAEDGAVPGGSAESPGWRAYSAYRARARFPEHVRETVETMLGIMHFKPPAIELPAELEPMRERATLQGESLEMLLRRVNEEQLTVGRIGLLGDVPTGAPAGAVVPYISTYTAERVVNWDVGEIDRDRPEALNLVVLEETEVVRDGFEWEEVEKYRVLVLGDLDANEQERAGAPYRVATFTDRENFREEDLIEPTANGNTLDELPFVIANTRDITSDADVPPLLGLSNLTLTIYRGEADYRQSLFLQGQDTLVTIGAPGLDDDGQGVETGTGRALHLPIGGDAKYVGVDSSGLPEQRTALENDYNRAEARSNALVEAVGRSAESGEALKVRVAARTSSLTQIALTGAFALQELLRKLARWIGANPDEVIVTPNLDFVSDTLAASELSTLMGAKMLGAPISLESIHELMAAKGLTDRTFEEEIELMTAESEAGMSFAQDTGDEAGSTNGDGPVDDEDLEDDDGPPDGGGDGEGDGDGDE